MWPFGGARKRRVLIVDDDVHVRTMLGMYFGDSGWDTSEASDGQMGYESAVTSPPDIILLDIDMPVMTGPEALALLRTNEKTKAVPIVMVTARGTLDDVDNCISRGANDYVNKPFDFSRLKTKVDKLVPPA